MLFEIDSLFITSYGDKWNKTIKNVKVPSSWNVMNKRVRDSDYIDPTRINYSFKCIVSYINLLNFVVEDEEEIDLPVVFMVYAMYCDKDCNPTNYLDESPLNINRRLSKLLDVPYETIEKIECISLNWEQIDFPIENMGDIDEAYSFLIEDDDE